VVQSVNMPIGNLSQIRDHLSSPRMHAPQTKLDKNYY
jgi:hypothetical protein